MEAAEAILIDEADLPSLVAASFRTPRGLVLVHPHGGDAAAARRAEIVSEHEAALGATSLVLGPPSGIQMPGDGPLSTEALASTLVESLVLVQAATLAATLGAARVIWPKQVGPDPLLVEVALERATLAAALAGATSGCPPPAMETPLLDLADEQVVDLAEDEGVPARAFWPCDMGGQDPCGHCPGCARWLRAFEAQGVPWPWLKATAGS